VTAPIVMHGKWDDNYDDPTHPIASLTALDIHASKHGGGADLVIIVAKPLQSDERSQKRLLDKIESYLRFLTTPEFEALSGIPSVTNTSVIVRLHPGSDAAIVDLLERSKPWVAKNFASLTIEPLALAGESAAFAAIGTNHEYH
jgi:hypothetical protein